MAGVYGQAAVHPRDDAIAGSFGTWTLTYTVGRHGVDDLGTILIARRMASDWGVPQFDRPLEAGYTTVSTTGQARLQAWFDPAAHIRPWKAALVIRVSDGSLAPGDRVSVVFGDRRAGGPGIQAQSFPEESFEFRVLVDCFGTGQYVLLPDSPTVRVVGGPVARLRLTAPSSAVVGRPFAVTVKAEDRGGNPAPGYAGQVRFASADPGAALPAAYAFAAADGGAHRFENVLLTRPGVQRLTVRDEAAGVAAESNPIDCTETAPALGLYWGDIHGQTESTVGTGTVDEYFRYGRDVAALDFISHCGNDFQITGEHFAETWAAVKRYHETGRFVTFLAYEWSGNSAAGGDHNVYFLHDDEPIHRSSHWQIADRSDEETDRYPITALHETYRGRSDVLIIPHVGGRPATLDYHHPDFGPVIEIQSVHGLFYWFAEEAIRRGLKVGFIAGSDDHTGRPGSTFPSGSPSGDPSGGAIHFGMRGGLLAALAAGLTREALWEAIRRRRCYGTTGERTVLDVTADGHPMGDEYRTSAAPSLAVRVLGTAPLESVELHRGLELIYRHPLAPVEPGRRLLVVWSGARVKGRRRETVWDGELALAGARITAARPFAFEVPGEGILESGPQVIRWRSTTCGDPDGLLLDVEMDAEAAGEAALTFRSPPCSFTLALRELGAGPRVLEAGGVDQRVEVAWAPAREGPREVEFKHVDAGVRPGVNPYYVRVRQLDGEMAWSSPIYVERDPSPL